jgi:replicative DNA helicase
MNYEYQNQVLGMVIYRPERYWPEVKNKWNPEIFGDVDRIKIATVIQELLNSDVEFNHTVLKDKLNGHSATMLIPILGNYIPETNITFFMDQLLSWHNLKNLVLDMSAVCQEILSSQNTDKPEKIVTKIKNIYDKSEKCVTGMVEFHNMREMIALTVERIEERIVMKKNGKVRGYSTGIQKLDEFMQGFIPGRFYIIAARTSVGKTSFASFATLQAIKQSAKPLFFSNEMDKEDLIEKFIAAEAKISTHKFQTGDMNDMELSALVTAANDLANLRAVVDEKNGWDLDTLLSTVHRLHRRGECDMVVVDYLQQVRVKSAKTKYEQVSAVSDEMKKLSRELAIPVIGLAQINREAERGPVKEVPSLSHLKDSGSLEQDADMVMILHKDDISSEETIMSIAKNRYGKTGSLKLRHKLNINTYVPFL